MQKAATGGRAPPDVQLPPLVVRQDVHDEPPVHVVHRLPQVAVLRTAPSSITLKLDSGMTPRTAHRARSPRPLAPVVAVLRMAPSRITLKPDIIPRTAHRARSPVVAVLCTVLYRGICAAFLQLRRCMMHLHKLAVQDTGTELILAAETIHIMSNPPHW